VLVWEGGPHPFAKLQPTMPYLHTDADPVTLFRVLWDYAASRKEFPWPHSGQPMSEAAAAEIYRVHRGDFDYVLGIKFACDFSKGPPYLLHVYERDNGEGLVGRALEAAGIDHMIYKHLP
jgi:hypothetical protein